MKETMKEVVIIGPKQFEVREVPVPKPADNEVLIQMKAAGVCGSDVHQFLGENPNAVFPRVPGHENAGVIVEVGKDVKNVKVGDHVVVDLVVACGECPQCRAGRRNVCRQVKARGSAIDGGWREYFAVPEHEVYVMPKELPFRDAALIEPFAIGGHCTARANIQGGETVVLLSKGEIDSKKVRVEFSLEDMDMSGFQKDATYEQIKAYVLEHTGLKVSSLYISQIKRKCGLDVGQNYNLSKKEDAKVPKCPPEKEAAIRDALKYFQMI